MLVKSGLFLFLLSVFQVSSGYNVVKPDFERAIESESSAESSSLTRIVSGWEAKPGQHPHHAYLRYVDAAGGMRKCGGSIVSRDWVITAARCSHSRILVIVRAGGVSLTDPEYIFETTEWYNEPRYNGLSTAVQQHDISLLKLQRPLVYTRLVKPIRVQSSSDAFRDYAGERVITSGNGEITTSGPTSDVLRWVYLRVITNAACRNTHSTSVFDTTICAQFYNVTSQSTCFEDNGGPLVHVGPDGVPTLIGVTSFFAARSNGGCETGRPVGFTRPGPYLSWFRQVTGIDFENLQEDDENEDTTDSEEQEPDVTTSSPPPEDDGEDSDSNDDDMIQLLKRLEVNVKVKVAINKFNVTQNVGKEIDIPKQ